MTKPTFEKLYIEMTFSIDPVSNPELGLKEVLTTRRGISCHRTAPVTFKDMVGIMSLELDVSLRALKHFLSMHGYIEDDGWMPRAEYLERIAEELRDEGYAVLPAKP